MIPRFYQNDWVQKRFVFTQPGHAPEAGGNTAAPAEEDQYEHDAIHHAQKNVEGSIGQILGVEAQRLIGKNGETLSPKVILANIKKLFSADEAWVIRTYEGLYGPFTPGTLDYNKRREIAEKEWARYSTLLDATDQKIARKILQRTSKPEFTTAFHAITGWTLLNKKDLGTSQVVRDLNLDSTATVKYFRVRRRLKELQTQIPAKELQVKALRKESADHEAQRGTVTKSKEKYKEILESISGFIKDNAVKMGVATVALTTVGSLGYGFLGMGGGEGNLVNGFVALKDSIGWELSKIGEGYMGIAESLNTSGPGLFGLGALGMGVLHFMPGIPMDWAGKLKHWSKTRGLNKKVSAFEKKIGLTALRDEQKVAQEYVDTFQRENTDRVNKLKGEMSKHERELARLQTQIGERTARDGKKSKIRPLQKQVAAEQMLVLELDSVLNVMNAVQTPDIVDPHLDINEPGIAGRLLRMTGLPIMIGGLMRATRLKKGAIDTISAIGRSVEQMQLSPSVEAQLKIMAEKRLKEFVEAQGKLLDAKLNPNMGNEIHALHGHTPYPEIIDFLNPDTPKKWQPRNLEKFKGSLIRNVRGPAPQLYQLITSLLSLPINHVLQNQVRQVFFDALADHPNEPREVAVIGHAHPVPAAAAGHGAAHAAGNPPAGAAAGGGGGGAAGGPGHAPAGGAGNP